MTFNIWSILLIASASQCVFLMIMLLLRPSGNKRAVALLLFLLGVILAITINNIWYASYLYRSILGIAGFARGMILLMGPALFLYMRAITSPDFKFRWIHLLHLFPYMLIVASFALQDANYNEQMAVILIDQFMNGELPVGVLSILRFVVYFLHLFAYILVARTQMRKAIVANEQSYLVPLTARINWLKNLSAFLFSIGVTLIILTGYMLATDTYMVGGNFILTLLTSAIVYFVAYHALLNNKVIIADFMQKYSTVKLKDQLKESLVSQLIHSFEHDKIYTNPELKIGMLAETLDTKPHVLSTVINTKLGKSFNEFVNHYRIEEFIARSKDPSFSNHSIIGIAYDVGYNSKSSFYTAFKKHTGLTPTEFLQTQN